MSDLSIVILVVGIAIGGLIGIGIRHGLLGVVPRKKVPPVPHKVAYAHGHVGDVYLHIRRPKGLRTKHVEVIIWWGDYCRSIVLGSVNRKGYALQFTKRDYGSGILRVTTSAEVLVQPGVKRDPGAQVEDINDGWEKVWS